MIMGDEVYYSHLENESLTQVSADVVFLTETYQTMVAEIKKNFGSEPFSAAQARDLFNSSRKYIMALLEYLDNKGITRRNGDERICL